MTPTVDALCSTPGVATGHMSAATAVDLVSSHFTAELAGRSADRALHPTDPHLPRHPADAELVTIG